MRTPPYKPLLGLFTGYVVSNKDPLVLSRVRIKIPGLIEPASAWAWPLGSIGGGSKNRGILDTPDEGAEVGVLFREGDVDAPYYLAGNWGAPGGVSEIPEPARLAGVDAHKVKVWETGTWRITMDDRTGLDSKMLIENKATGDKIEFDGSTPGIQIEAKAAIVIKALGVVNIQGAQIVLNGRLVRPGGDPI